MGHTSLVLPFPFPMLLCDGFLGQLSNFKANIWKREGKGCGAQHVNVDSI